MITGLKNGLAIAIFLLGSTLFCYPILSVFNSTFLILGIPLLFVYIFAVWSGLIMLIYLASKAPKERVVTKKPETKPPEERLPFDSVG